MGVSVSVERLRVWLLVGAGLLVAVVAAFLGYAHYRTHRFLTELPGRLGVDIRQETNAFTYSQSDGKKTIYTIHAAKAIEHKDGKYTLRDVGIVLYGRKAERADRIYGNEFEYDQGAGLVRAVGEVQLDLEAPAAKDAAGKMDYAAGHDLSRQAGDVTGGRTIHVTTSGLVYQQKLGVASTDQGVTFEAGGMKGQAVGADYSSNTGLVTLHSAVKMVGLERGRPVVVTASRAELDRDNQTVTLSGAKYEVIGGASRSGEEERAQAENVIVHLRSDGSVERLNVNGEVKLEGGDGDSVMAPSGVMLLNAKSEPQSAILTGGVTYGIDEPLRKAAGKSTEARAAFDPTGHLKGLVLTGAVRMHERQRGAVVSSKVWNERNLNADAVELALSADRAGKMELQNATATGDARLAITNRDGSKSTSSSMAADRLTARFIPVDGVVHLEEVRGEGHTMLRRMTSAGVVNTSSGDSLDARFRQVMGSGLHSVSAGATAKQAHDEIASAVVQGHVVLTRQTARNGNEGSPLAEARATAERAVYDAKLGTTTLTGNVQVADAGSMLWADRVVADQATGNAVADGSVKVSYLQPGSDGVNSKMKSSGAGEEPVHVLAARAELKHDSGVTTFFGGAGRPARLWEEASQVEAPIIQFDQKKKSLLARGDEPGAGPVVHALLTSSAKPEGGKDGARRMSVLRVASRELSYSDMSREATFSDGVRVMSVDGKMDGQQVVVYLQPASAEGAGKAHEKTVASVQNGFMGGSVERMVASGHVVIGQSGRRATGEQVVYTASDGMFVLTGTASAPPQVVDDERGTVTGTVLRFHAGDDSVVVSNGGKTGAGERVRTETRVKKH